MQYQVPQFIEVEDKIFGPLTFKQFIYLAGGGGVCLIFVTILPLFIAIILGAPVVIFSLALAFYKVNGRPFIYALEHAFNYFTSSKLYLWRQREQKAEGKPDPVKIPAASTLSVPALSQSRLKDLSWSLNIKDREQSGVVPSERSHLEL